ncbi:MAG: putative metal-binding motif-containing protein [Deltaproteobacteria bacterium]|nr:putative metal-binding motif-containing protein [Deltaproteobacteria bacterium]
MRRRQPETSGGRRTRAVLLLAAWLAAPACSLRTSGVDDDVGTDATDVDVPPVDVVDDDGDDGPGPDGSECSSDDDCGDPTCAREWRHCLDGRCVPMGPWECPQDLVLCTSNVCTGGDSACIELRPPRCSPTYTCHEDFGCVNERSCSSDGECGDGIDCTIDSCAPGGLYCIHNPPDADADTVGGNFECNAEGRDCACPGGDCDDTDPTVSPDLPEVCRNGRDDDCDTLPDYTDTESACADLGDHDTCETAVPLIVDARFPLLTDELTEELAVRELNSWCILGSSFDGRAAYFQLDLTGRPGLSRVLFDTKDCGFDTVLSLFQGCGAGAPELICNDNRHHDATVGSRFEHRRLEPGLYVVRVAGRWPDQFGTFELHFSVQDTGGEAGCGSPIEATDGGTFIGRLSDPGEALEGPDAGSCIRSTSLGDQERFVVRPDGVVDLVADATGTPFDHAVYVRSGSCSGTPGTDNGCASGTSGAPAVLILPEWAGTAYLTLDWEPPMLTSGNPGQPYTLLILL